jgi:hypothetical protein
MQHLYVRQLLVTWYHCLVSGTAIRPVQFTSVRSFLLQMESIGLPRNMPFAQGTVIVKVQLTAHSNCRLHCLLGKGQVAGG